VGKLSVTDRELFKKGFQQGLGRAKSFGFGLLQIVPLQK
jgi:CRISPR system Cascade subunit CasE